MATTLAQQKAVAIAPKLTAFASILGSSTCIFLLLKRSPKKKTYHRLVLGMSLCDLSASTAWFFTTWPIPAGTEGVYGAVGDQQTVRNKISAGVSFVIICSPVIILIFVSYFDSARHKRSSPSSPFQLSCTMQVLQSTMLWW